MGATSRQIFQVVVYENIKGYMDGENWNGTPTN